MILSFSKAFDDMTRRDSLSRKFIDFVLYDTGLDLEAGRILFTTKNTEFADGPITHFGTTLKTLDGYCHIHNRYRMVIYVNPETFDDSHKLQRVLAHELRHVHQTITGRLSECQKYWDGTKIPKGIKYKDLPHEIDAREYELDAVARYFIDTYAA